MTVESIDLILKLWQTDPPFDFQGDFYHIKLEDPIPQHGIGTLLQPFQKPHPPIAMSVIRAQSKAARMAGQRGYIPISSNLVQIPTLVKHWQTYCAAAKEAEQPTPDRCIWRIARSIYIDETTDAAWDHATNGADDRTYEGARAGTCDDQSYSLSLELFPMNALKVYRCPWNRSAPCRTVTEFDPMFRNALAEGNVLLDNDVVNIH